VSPLDKKLWRDLRRVKGQAAAIGLVIALGVMMQVMMSGLVHSLQETRAEYYERYRLADIFAPVRRAPNSVALQLAGIEGVSRVETRVTGMVLINIPSRDLPVMGRALSLPPGGDPGLNAIYMSTGRMFDAAHPEEIVLLDSFAEANGLSAGDSLVATINGAQRQYRIVGTARSPEYLYTTAPGELVPDDARFGVIWMNRDALAAAYDMVGAFSEALFAINRDAIQASVLQEIDHLLKPFGGGGAYGLEDQYSNRFVSEEMSGLEVSASGVPPFFLAVAAFLLYIVVSRMVQAEREEIGLMKAFGYRNREVGWHYMKMVLVIAIGGAIAGCLIGIGTGRAMINLYTMYFKFPFLVFVLDPMSFVSGVSVSILSASIGGLFVMRRIFRMAPADAMRPPAPTDYSAAGQIGAWFAKYLDQPSRMVLRRVTRQPGRMMGAVLGIAAGMALTLSMITIYAGFERTLDLTFTVVDRSDVTVSFARPVGEDAIFALRRIPGVEVVEPTRAVGAVLRNGRFSHQGAVTGLTVAPELIRAIDSDYSTIEMPESGIVLAKELADLLDIKPGEMLAVEIMGGRQPVVDVPVVAIAQSLLGAPAYMGMEALNRALGEPGLASGAYLLIDKAFEQEIFAALRDMPMIAGVSLKSEMRTAFETLMNQGAGATRYVMGLVAFIITFGIVSNAARVAQAERARDLASLRVIGFHRGETAFVLLGELAVVTLLALPVGSLMGHYMSYAVAEGFSTELYQIPSLFLPESHGYSALVVIAAALFSGWLVKRDLDRADITTALKTRE